MFNAIEELDYIDVNTPCKRCGFLLFKHASDKMQAVLELLQNDIHAKELLEQKRYKEFNEYLVLKMEIQDPNKIV